MSEINPASAITVGIDLGTSAVKVVAVGADAQPIGEAAAAFATYGTESQQAEQDPSDWLHAVSGAMRHLAESVSHLQGPSWTSRVAAIGLTGQLPTLVCLSDHAPIAPAITWKDGRADRWAAARVDLAARARMYAATGMPIDGRYLAPMLQFHFRDRLDEVRGILSAKDFLLLALTGLRITEPSTAAGYGIYDLRTQRFSEELAEFWRLPPRVLPRIEPANSLAGPLTAEGASLLGLPVGVPVSTGAGDSVCSAYAMAGLDERVASISFGSSAVLVAASAAPQFDRAGRYLLTPHVLQGWYGREMDLLASGTGYRWLSDLFDWAEGQIDHVASQSVPGAHGLFFPPYLAGGEQGALWNPRLQGALFGLTLRHTRADIARAYLEGVFFEIRRCMEVLAESGPIESVRVSGYIVHSPSSLQMLADILQKTVGSVLDASPAAFGAALLARRLGGASPLDEWRPLTSRSRSLTSPHPPTAQAYVPLYKEYVARAAACA